MDNTSAANIITAYYGFDASKLKIEQIKLGAENTNYSVTMGSQRYVLRIYNPEHSIRGLRTPDSIKLELQFMHQAAQQDIPTPAAIELLQGGILGNNNNAYFVLFNYIAGEHPEYWDNSVVSELGRAVSALYEVGSSFNQESNLNDFTIIKRALAQYETLCQLQTSKNFIVIDTIHTLHKQLKSDELSLELLKVGFIHGDIKLENTLFLHNKLKAILDFDDYRYSYLLEETVSTLMHNLHDSNMNCIRSGNYDKFINEITNSELLSEIDNSLKTLLRARLLYDLCKYTTNDNQILINQILNDENVIATILS